MINTLVAGQSIPALVARHSPERIQPLLRQVRFADASASCLCRTPGLRLAVRERTGKFFLAAWRDEAELHSPGCPFYSERDEYKPAAGVPDSPKLQDEILHDRRSRSYVVRRIQNSEGEDQTDLMDALHQLWYASALNRWYPGWSRDYGLARKVLYKAAEAISVGDEPLSENLYIPQVYRPEFKNEINIRWDEFLTGAKADPSARKVPHQRYVLGQVRLVAETQFGWEIRLLHNGTPLYMSDRMMSRVRRNNRKGWACLQPTDAKLPQASGVIAPHERNRLICLAQVIRSKSGHVHITRAALMRTTLDLIPANNRFECELAEALVREDREFFRPMSHEESRLGLPSYVLKDTDPTRRKYTELFIVGNDGATPAMEERHVRDLGLEAQRRHRDVLYWSLREQSTLPVLPPAAPWAPAQHA